MIAPAAATTVTPHPGRPPAPAATGVLAFALPGGEEDATAAVDGEPRQDDADPGKALPTLPDAALLALFGAPVTLPAAGTPEPIAAPCGSVPTGSAAYPHALATGAGLSTTTPVAAATALPAVQVEAEASGQALALPVGSTLSAANAAEAPSAGSDQLAPRLSRTRASTGSARADGAGLRKERAGDGSTSLLVHSPEVTPASVQRAKTDVADARGIDLPAATPLNGRPVARPAALGIAPGEAVDSDVPSRFAAAGTAVPIPATSSSPAPAGTRITSTGAPLPSGAATILAPVNLTPPMPSGDAALPGVVRPDSGPLVAPVPLPPHWQVLAQVPAAAPTSVAPAVALAMGSIDAVERPKPRSLPDGTPPDAAPLLAAAAAPTIAPTAGGERAALDLRQDSWPQGMIRHIERLQDAVDAADTRIRLVPDALGSVDVDVRRDGDTLHVRFSAEQAQTRALIQDAQPRLAEAAEQRGLRLGQTSVDAGASGQGQQRSAQQPAAPRPAPSRRPERDAPAADDRIA